MAVEDATTRSMEILGVTIPFLFHGEPIMTNSTMSMKNRQMSLINNDSSSTLENITENVRVTEETSFRGRALNISAPEPTNSLHPNITDLSDVSMDDDDKEVEGDYYTKY